MSCDLQTAAGRHPTDFKLQMWCFPSCTSSELTEWLEDVRDGFIGGLPVRLVSLRAVLGSFPLVLVAGLASVASPPVVALGNVHADVDGVMTCSDTVQRRGSRSDYTQQKKRKRKKKKITLILNSGKLYHRPEGQTQRELVLPVWSDGKRLLLWHISGVFFGLCWCRKT